jgi:hypothetical protein
MKPSISKPVLIAKLLDLHLSRSIERLKAEDMASKMQIAAQMVADRKKALDERAQALIDKMPAFDSRANQAFEKHEGVMTSAEEDFKAMEEMLHDMEGSNSKNSQEGSGDTSESSFQRGEKG